MSYYLSSPETSSIGSPYDSSLLSRPSSTSPTLASSFPQLAKLRQDACRGFDLEDDNEFCPALTSLPLYAPYAGGPYAVYAAGALSPPMSPPSLQHTNATSPTNRSAGSPVTATFQAVGHHRRALEIIDPATGLPVSRR